MKKQLEKIGKSKLFKISGIIDIILAGIMSIYLIVRHSPIVNVIQLFTFLYGSIFFFVHYLMLRKDIEWLIIAIIWLLVFFGSEYNLLCQ